MMSAMVSIELAQAFESARAQQSWMMLTDLLRSQGHDHLTVDGVRAFHAEVPDGIVGRGVNFAEGSGRALTATLFTPSTGDGPFPAVVFVHGGGWMAGHSVMHNRHAAHLAADGFVALTINYRLMQEALWPAPVDDVAAAVAYLRANADELGVDPMRVAISGGSAGGHLAALAVAQSTGTDAAVQAAVLWYPVLDVTFAHTPEMFRTFLGNTLDTLLDGAPRAAASPAAHLRAGHPPVLTLVGEQDTAAPPVDAEDYHAQLRALGVDNELHIEAGVGHAFEIDPKLWDASYIRMRDFLRRVL